MDCKSRPSEGQRKMLKGNVISTIDEFGFRLMNQEQIRSRRDYNKYVIEFPSVFDFAAVRKNII